MYVRTEDRHADTEVATAAAVATAAVATADDGEIDEAKDEKEEAKPARLPPMVRILPLLPLPLPLFCFELWLAAADAGRRPEARSESKKLGRNGRRRPAAAASAGAA